MASSIVVTVRTIANSNENSGSGGLGCDRSNPSNKTALSCIPSSYLTLNAGDRPSMMSQRCIIGPGVAYRCAGGGNKIFQFSVTELVCLAIGTMHYATCVLTWTYV